MTGSRADTVMLAAAMIDGKPYGGQNVEVHDEYEWRVRGSCSLLGGNSINR